MDMILSQEELNQIQSIDSLEELKSFIFDSIESNDNTSNSENFCVRILSNKEYDKIIQSETLDGSIIKNDINVWHYYNNLPSNISFGSATNSNALMTTGSIIRELMLDNVSNTGASKAKTSFYCNAYCSWMGSNYTWTSNIVDYYNKNFASGRVHVSANGGIRWDGYHRLAYAYYDVSLAFRPVFQFIDNVKSKNIFY